MLLKDYNGRTGRRRPPIERAEPSRRRGSAAACGVQGRRSPCRGVGRRPADEPPRPPDGAGGWGGWGQRTRKLARVAYPAAGSITRASGAREVGGRPSGRPRSARPVIEAGQPPAIATDTAAPYIPAHFTASFDSAAAGGSRGHVADPGPGGPISQPLRANFRARLWAQRKPQATLAVLPGQISWGPSMATCGLIELCRPFFRELCNVGQSAGDASKGSGSGVPHHLHTGQLTGLGPPQTAGFQ